MSNNKLDRRIINGRYVLGELVAGSKSARRAIFIASIDGLSAKAVINKASLFPNFSREKFSVIKLPA